MLLVEPAELAHLQPLGLQLHSMLKLLARGLGSIVHFK